ncbi:MAG TPA: hypothetical protein VFP65_02610 [Anaeromyxobacteraceae bacterium]|nr:hypothetical protein [Anaeromyxobacteraceae bacterium]
MNDGNPTMVVVVRPADTPRKSIEVLRWLRWLLPAALLVVSAGETVALGDQVITIDAEEIESGPLSLADALERAARGHLHRGP